MNNNNKTTKKVGWRSNTLNRPRENPVDLVTVVTGTARNTAMMWHDNSTTSHSKIAQQKLGVFLLL